MRGIDHQQADMYSYVSPEARVRADHPLRKIRTMADEALNNMSARFDAMYAKIGRPSIPPEKLLRAQLLQMLFLHPKRSRHVPAPDNTQLKRPLPGVPERQCIDRPGPAQVGGHPAHPGSEITFVLTITRRI